MATATERSRGIARAVSSALRDAGIAQRDAAARTGIPLVTLSRRLTGNSPFLITELDLLADLLGRTLDDLIAAGGSQDEGAA